MSCVAAIIPTYRREAELRRLLECLQKQNRPPDLVVIVDNAGDDAVREMLALLDGPGPLLKTVYLPLAGNPGCGSALVHGMKKAEEILGGQLSYFLNLDDDVVLGENLLERLLETMTVRACLAAVPQIVDGFWKLEAGPEPWDKKGRAVRKRVARSDEWRNVFGRRHQRVRWFRGPCYLISLKTVRELGYPREDFWMLGEDIEYSMRLSAVGECLADLDAVVEHLPPPPVPSMAVKSHQKKFRAMLQNLFYMAAHLPHCRRVWRYLPGHCLRYLRTFRPLRVVIADLIEAFGKGVFFARPAGR